LNFVEVTFYKFFANGEIQVFRPLSGVGGKPSRFGHYRRTVCAFLILSIDSR
jgi:hypothetical protein